MGAKTSLLVHADGDPADLLRHATDPDLPATTTLVTKAHPTWNGTTTPSRPLSDALHLPVNRHG